MKTIFLFFMVSFGLSVISQSQEVAEKKVAVVLDGKLDERRDEVMKLLKKLDYKPLDIPKESPGIYSFHKEWVNWVHDEGLSKLPDYKAEDKQFIIDTLHFYFRDHYDPIEVGLQVKFLNSSSDKPKNLSLAARCAKQIVYDPQRIKYAIHKKLHESIIKHKDFKSLPPLALYLVYRAHYLKVRSPENKQLLIDALAAVVACEKCNQPQYRMLIAYELVETAEFLGFPEKLMKLPKLPESTQLTLVGAMKVRKAWQVRGNKFANKVGGDRMLTFMDVLKEARESLQDAYSLNEENFIATYYMLLLSKADQVDDMRVWLDRSLAIYCDERRTIQAYTLGIEPKWGGSIKEMIGFGVACALEERHDTLLGKHTERLLTAASIRMRRKGVFYEDELMSWLILEAGQGCLSGPKGSHYDDYSAFHSAHALIIGEMEIALKKYDFLMTVKDGFFNFMMKDAGKDPADMLEQFHVAKAGCSELLAEMETQLDNSEFEKVLATCKKVEDKLKAFEDKIELPSSVIQYAGIAQFNIDQKNSKENELVKLPLTANQSVWIPLQDASDQSLIKDGVMLGGNETRIGIFATDTTESYEFQATLTTLRILEMSPKDYSFGIIYGFQDNVDPESERPFDFGMCVLEFDQKGKGHVQLFGTEAKKKEISVDIEKLKNKSLLFTVKVIKGKISVSLDGKELYKDVAAQILGPIEAEDGSTFYGDLGLLSQPKTGSVLVKELYYRDIK